MKQDKFGLLIFILIVVLLLLTASAIRAQIVVETEKTSEQQISGGTFTLTKTVIAGGGAELQNQTRAAQNTSGQAIAGGVSSGGTFSLRTGFWIPENFAPTAAPITVSGRVMTKQGKGIRNASVTILFPTGETRSTSTGFYGAYSFGDIEAGQTYIFTVSSKRFAFAQTMQILSLTEDRNDVDFVAADNQTSLEITGR